MLKNILNTLKKIKSKTPLASIVFKQSSINSNPTSSRAAETSGNHHS